MSCQDNDADEVGMLSAAVVEPYGLWLSLRNPSDDVEQDEASVGLLLTVAVGEVHMFAHHLVVVVAAAQLSLSLPIWMSASLSSLCFLNLMTNDDPGCGLLMTIEVPVDDVDGDAVAEADAAATVVSS